MTDSAPPRRRADAERSRGAILDAATRVLARRPAAGLATIAAEAGLTRQTVYAHFTSRDELVDAVADRLTERTLAAISKTDPESGSATRALLALLDESWRAFESLPALRRQTAGRETADSERHAPVRDHLVRLIGRGQRTGEFDATADPDWLAAAVIGLGHAAGEQVESGRMSLRDAGGALRDSALRLLGATGEPDEPAAVS
ncbi:TetR/AcrR family transcriptional regulator [Nocardia sp. NPDC003345]